tara:strand:- start:1357 stop:1521 length:165 start_codon:yes stop_codon:yes gene_type:complete
MGLDLFLGTPKSSNYPEANCTCRPVKEEVETQPVSSRFAGGSLGVITRNGEDSG